MYKIRVNRTCELRVPHALCVENQNDFTHFTHLHRKVILEYRLLFKLDKREIFLYKARRLYPLPFYDTYIVFREYIPAEEGYHNVYLNVRSGLVHYLQARTVCCGETSSVIGEYVFSLPSYWRFFPRLFYWVFKRRMHEVMEEDNIWFRSRMSSHGEINSQACAPVIPESYDLLNDLLGKGVLPTADIEFEDHVMERFEDLLSSVRRRL